MNYEHETVIVENIETSSREQCDWHDSDLAKKVSEIMGYDVECLDYSRNWFYFWKKGSDFTESDACAIAIVERRIETCNIDHYCNAIG